MKKLIGIGMLSFGLFLTGCGSDDEVSNEEELSLDEMAEQEAPDITSDPMEIAMNDHEYFSGGFDDYKVMRYTSNQADEDGLINIEENGYEFKFTVIYGEAQYGDEDSILIVGEQQNTNEDGGSLVWATDDIIADGEEKVGTGIGYEDVAPGIKSKVLIEHSVEYGMPDEIVIEGGWIDETNEDGYQDEQPKPIELDETYTFHRE